MSEQTRLEAARRREEATMLSTCRVLRFHLEESTDTGVIELADTNPDDDTVLESPCKVIDRSVAVFYLNTEGQSLADQRLMLSLPVHTSGAVRMGDTVRIVDGGPDPALTGEQFRIAGIPLTTRATSRRFSIEHVA